MTAFLAWLSRPLWRFWVEPIRAEPVAAFRIAVGVVVLASALLSLGPRMAIDLGPDGLTPPDVRGREYKPGVDDRGNENDTGSLDAWLKKTGTFCLQRGFIGVPLLDVWLPREHLGGWVTWCEDGGFWWLYGLYVVSLVCVIAGYRTRLATFVALMLTVSFHARMNWVLNGGDSVMRDALFCLMFMPAAAVWSVDSSRRARRDGPPPGPVMVEPWSVRLAMVQVACIYLFTGLVKLGDTTDYLGTFLGAWWAGDPLGPAWATLRSSLAAEDWLNGQAVYWVLNDNAVNRFPYHWIPIPMPLCRLLSWATLIFEIGFPFIVLFGALRPWLLVGGVLFHLGIWFHTEVGYFSWIMIAWYPLYLSGEWLAWLVSRREPPAPDAEEGDPDEAPTGRLTSSPGRRGPTA